MRIYGKGWAIKLYYKKEKEEVRRFLTAAPHA
jgi:hypothetical protein